MDNPPTGAEKPKKSSRVVLTNAQRQEWRDYWASMPPKPVYPRTCCVCGAEMADHLRYVCEECSERPD